MVKYRSVYKSLTMKESKQAGKNFERIKVMSCPISRLVSYNKLTKFKSPKFMGKTQGMSRKGNPYNGPVVFTSVNQPTNEAGNSSERDVNHQKFRRYLVEGHWRIIFKTTPVHNPVDPKARLHPGPCILTILLQGEALIPI